MTQRPDPLAEPPSNRAALLRRLAGQVSSRGNLGGFFFSGHCDAGRRWQLGNEACAQPSAEVVHLGCLSEHVEPMELCGTHAQLIEGATLYCIPCASAGCPGRPMAVIKREKV